MVMVTQLWSALTELYISGGEFYGISINLLYFFKSVGEKKKDSEVAY